MEIVKHIKNNAELKKEILKKIVCQEIELKVACYTSSDEDTIITDLEVNIYEDEECVDTVTCYSVESTGDFDVEMDKHRKELKKLKDKTFKYLKLHFSNVELASDYTE